MEGEGIGSGLWFLGMVGIFGRIKGGFEEGCLGEGAVNLFV